MLDDVKDLIYNLTEYEISDEDMSLVTYFFNAEKQHILNFCNLSELPTELKYTLIEMTVGRFLTVKKAEILGADNLNLATSIKEGDTQVQFGGSTVESRYNDVVAYLLRERDLICYRKIKW